MRTTTLTQITESFGNVFPHISNDSTGFSAKYYLTFGNNNLRVFRAKSPYLEFDVTKNLSLLRAIMTVSGNINYGSLWNSRTSVLTPALLDMSFLLFKEDEGSKKKLGVLGYLHYYLNSDETVKFNRGVIYLCGSVSSLHVSGKNFDHSIGGIMLDDVEKIRGVGKMRFSYLGRSLHDLVLNIDGSLPTRSYHDGEKINSFDTRVKFKINSDCESFVLPFEVPRAVSYDLLNPTDVYRAAKEGL